MYILTEQLCKMPMKQIFLIILILSICNCTSIPTGSLFRLITLDPIDLEPSNTAVALKAPNYVRISSGNVVLKIGKVDSSGNTEFEYVFPLAAKDTPFIPKGIYEQIRRDEKLTVFKISDPDVIKIISLKEQIEIHIASGGRKEDYYLGITITGGCKTENFIQTVTPYSLYLKTDSESEYFTMIKDYDIRNLNLSPHKNIDQWELCQNLDTQL